MTISRDHTVKQAITLMVMYGYSQLPVAQGGRPKGKMISWRSIGQARTGGRACEYVRDCMEDIRTMGQDAPLLPAINEIAEQEVVLVLGDDRKIAGIVTTSDLAHDYHIRAAPFLLLEEIEDRIRTLISDKLPAEAIKGVQHHGDGSRIIEAVSDLDFGQYVSLLGTPDNWKALGLRIDRKLFVKLLDDVREIRNEVMHFSPDRTENLDKVRMLRRLLEQLAD